MEIPSILQSELNNSSPKFVLFSPKKRFKIFNWAIGLVVSFLLLMVSTHLILVILFEDHLLKIFSINEFFKFGKLIPFEAEKHLLLIPFLIILFIGVVGTFNSFKMLFNTKTHWVGTDNELYIVENNKKITKIIWSDFFGKILFSEVQNSVSFDLNYYSQKKERYFKIDKGINFFKEKLTPLERFERYCLTYKTCSIYAATGTENSEYIIRQLITKNSID